MKPIIPLLSLCAVLEAADASDQLLLTFDDRAGHIKHGYGGLNWNNFFIENASSNRWQYWGIVSPPNVAFNGLGEPASFSSSSGTPFTLKSAYFRAIYVDAQDIQVLGFRRGVLTYGNIITVTSGAPTFIEFDYIGIDYATFVILTVPRGIFAMDDLLILPADGDTDDDGDGVPDDQDRCGGTIAGAIVNEDGCSIDQMAPCSGPLGGGSWRNHGQYVNAVAATANDFLAAGLITPEDRDAVLRAAADSDCGKRAEPRRPKNRAVNEGLPSKIRKARQAYNVNF